jgi:CRP-like cAMP-binding protein
MPRKGVPRPAQPLPAFDLHTFLDSAGIARKISKYHRSAVIFSQGDPATEVFYIQEGSVKLSVLSRTGKEAVIGMLGGVTSSAKGVLRAGCEAW